MIRILCTGDSHTWGEGAAGIVESFVPPPNAGELRPTSFRGKSYVNQLRRMVEERTDSYSFEWQGAGLADALGTQWKEPCAVVGEKPVGLSAGGELIRLVIQAGDQPVNATVHIDQTSHAVVLPAGETPGVYHLLHFHCPPGEHQLTLRCEAGSFGLYRIESYGGSYCVLNAGVGSTPTFAYQNRYFDSHVAAAKPDIIVAEVHTVNDWLTGAPQAAYKTHLTNLLQSYLSLTKRVLVLTVAPIGGKQIPPRGGEVYSDLINVARETAEQLKLPLCDANRYMKKAIQNMTAKEAETFLLHDIWHPNDLGHTMYAQMLMECLNIFLQG